MVIDEKIQRLDRWKRAAREVLSSDQSLRRMMLQARLKAAKEKSRLKNLTKDLFCLLDLIKSYLNGSYRQVSYSNLVLIVVACLYFLSPFDLIIDVLPLGLVDDAQVLTIVLGACKR